MVSLEMVVQHIRLHSETANVARVDAHLVDVVGHDDVALVAALGRVVLEVLVSNGAVLGVAEILGPVFFPGEFVVAVPVRNKLVTANKLKGMDYELLKKISFRY